MIGTILIELAMLLLMLIANGVFALSELAVVSARKARLQSMAERGNKGAVAALQLTDSPGRFLSTVQIGITLIGVLAGAFGGATLAEELESHLAAIPTLAPYSEGISVFAVVLAITYFSLIIGELVPKQLALSNPEQAAALIARPMQWLAVLARPAVSLLTFSSDVVVQLLGNRPSKEASITEQEIALLIEQGTTEGVFEQAEQDMISRVLRLDARRAGSVMTPRTEIVWLDAQDTVEMTRQKIEASGFTYFPVGEMSVDRLLGIVSAQVWWSKTTHEEGTDLRELVLAPLYIPESLTVLEVLRLFKENRQDIALIINEYGGLEGLITLRDVLEAIVGDIPSLDQAAEEPEIVQRTGNSWLIDGLLPIEELKGRFHFGVLPGEAKAGFQTLGGFVVSYLERIPTVTDAFVWNGYEFEVVDMDGHRVDKILVSRLKASIHD